MGTNRINFKTIILILGLLTCILGLESYYPRARSNILITCHGQMNAQYRKEGLWRCYNRDGSKFSETEFHNGLKNGWFRAWTDEGSIDVEAQFKNGQLDGELTSYSPDGGTFRSHYKDGHFIHGLVEEWNLFGVKVFEVKYNMGALDGYERAWNFMGIPTAECFYRQGVLAAPCHISPKRTVANQPQIL